MKAYIYQSILRRTLFLVMSCFIIVATVISVAGIINANHEVEEVFDARLSQQARTLRSLVLGSLEHDLNLTQRNTFLDVIEKSFNNKKNTTKPHEYEHKVYFEIKVDNETWLGSSHTLIEKLSNSKKGFSYIKDKRHNWRTYHLISKIDDKDVSVLVAEREDIRKEMVEYIVLQSIIPQLISLPILAFFLMIAIRKGLSPIQRLATEISKRNPKKLEAVNISPLPSELKPIQSKLNDLLFNIEDMMAREQRFISDAAHELRTPLAVLKIHAQNALQTQNEQDKEIALKELEQGVDRSSRIVHQLLTLARLEQGKVDSNVKVRETIQMVKQARSTLAELYPLAEAKSLEITLDADEKLDWNLTMSQGIFDILIQNLISNAIKHSHNDGSIEVMLEQNSQYYAVKVIDHGVGISSDKSQPNAIKKRLIERFYREGSQAGAGLGLSIVHNIMQQFSGDLNFSHTENGGLTVILSLPIK